MADLLDLDNKNLENELHSLQSIFDSIADLAFVLDKEHFIRRVNASLLAHLQIKSSELVGKKCHEVLCKTDLLACSTEENDCPLDKVLLSGNPHTSIQVTSDGDSENYWEIQRTPIKNQQGEVDFVLATWRKITERIRLSREVASAEIRFQSFLNSAKDWISIKDIEGKYVVANPVIAKAFKLKPYQFIGKYPEEILPAPLPDMIKKHDSEVIAKSQPIVFDEIIQINGKDHHFQSVRFPLYDYKGEMIGICMIGRDITNEINLTEQLIRSEKLAAIGKLAAGIAHEINNPLTGILAFTEDLIDSLSSESQYQQDLNIILNETLRCRDIVRDLLDFARQEKPNFEKIEPEKIINNSIKLVAKLPEFRDIQLDLQIGQTGVLVELDPYQIQQVLLNLLINSAEAMNSKGRIIISANFDKEINVYSIVIADSGHGIPSDLKEKVFEPFFSTKGTNGLGLAVSWGIIERHRGELLISDSAELGGAEFTIKIHL